MAQLLRANTQVKVVIGPVVAVGDGFTPVTTLDLSTADEAEILKHDAAAVTSIAAATFAAITSADGYYNLTITTSLSDTEGLLTVLINDDSLCLPVKQCFMVLSEAAWDSMFVAKDDGFMDVNIKTIGRADTQETEATNLEAACANYSATRGLTGTALPAAAADAAGGIPISDAGGLDLDAKLANTNEVTAARMGALTDWINGGRLDLILDDILLDTGTTLQGELDGIQADTEDIQTRLPATLVNSRMDCTIDGTGMESGAVDAILNRDASGSTTNSTLGAIINDLEDGGRVDLLVDAIKAKTDSLTFTVAGDVDVNVQTWGGTAISTPPAVNATQISGSAAAANNAEIVYDTDFTANYSIIVQKWNVNVSTILGNVATTYLDGLFTFYRLDELLAADSDIDGAQPPTVGSVFHELMSKTAGSFTFDQTTDSQEAIRDNMGTAQTGDAYAIVNSGTHGNAALKTLIDTVDTVADEILVDTGTTLDGRIPAALTAAGNMKSDALAISGSTEAADRLERSALAIVTFTVGSGSSTTSIVTSACSPAPSSADQLKGRIVIFDKDTTTAALRGQATDITASSNSATPTLTVTALTGTPASGDTGTIT